MQRYNTSNNLLIATGHHEHAPTGMSLIMQDVINDRIVMDRYTVQSRQSVEHATPTSWNNAQNVTQMGPVMEDIVVQDPQWITTFPCHHYGQRSRLQRSPLSINETASQSIKANNPRMIYSPTFGKGDVSQWSNQAYSAPPRQDFMTGIRLSPDSSVDIPLSPGEKPFKCYFPGCQQRFTRLNDVHRHIKTHDNVNKRMLRLRCDICHKEKLYIRMDSLRRHMRQCKLQSTA